MKLTEKAMWGGTEQHQEFRFKQMKFHTEYKEEIFIANSNTADFALHLSHV